MREGFLYLMTSFSPPKCEKASDLIASPVAIRFNLACSPTIEELIEHDARCDRQVQRVALADHRNAHREVAGVLQSGCESQALASHEQHKRKTVGCFCIVICGRIGCADDHIVVLLLPRDEGVVAGSHEPLGENRAHAAAQGSWIVWVGG